MGQNASRQRPADIDPHSVPASTPSDRSPEVPQDRDTQPTLEQHTDTPRSSVRKSVLNFMRPSTLRSRVSSVASSSGDARRSWRNSRRWSKAPEDPANVVSSSPATSSASSSSSGLSTAPTSTIDRRKQPERNMVIESDSRNCDVTFDPDNPPSSPTSSILQPQPDYAASSSRSGPPEHPPPLRSEQPQTEDDTRHCDTTALGTPTDAPDTLHTRPQTPQLLSDPRPEPPSNRPTQPSPQPQRQFPPPGTLVVVQGIVHTTDVSRTNPEPNPALSRTAPTPPPGPSPPLSSSETEVNTGRTRNRLSALLRPRSSSSRPSSTHIPDPPPLSVSSPDLSPITSSDDHPGTPPTTLPAGSEDDSRTHDYPSGPDQGHENRSSISSSSIDVLGTLLSVAAAATAASLLTGSSEPILSSGLTPGAASTNSSPPSAATAVPPLPTPHVHPTNPSPPSPLHDSSVAGRTERMRQAWGTIRERLGLRPSPSADQRRPSDEALGAAPTDTRELMLAEMARAFNIGLGLNGLGGTQAQASSGAEGSAGEDVHHHALPPEGSFERFLVDLQIDLRTALTSPDDDENASDDASEDSDHESGSDIPPSVPVDVGAGRQEESSHRPLPSIPSIEINDESGSHPRPPGFSEMDSEDESDDEESVSESDSEDEQDFHSAHASNGGNAALGGDPTHTSGRIDSQGRINWWRLYRFPPIQSPRSGLHGSPPSSNPHQAQSSDSAPPQPTPSAPSFSDPLPFASVAEPPNHPNTGDSTAPSDADHPEPSAPFPAPPPLTSVVPVIVVGLQSVTSDWRPEGDAQQDHAGATHEGTDPFGMTHQHEDSLHTPASHMDDGDFDTFGQHQHHQQDLNHGSPYAPMSSNPESGSGGPTQSTRSRTRGWQHRAANAIRNLRPGRRSSNNNATQQPTNPAGSRTFLIYVIGGYYPPDHSIVTGGPHNFDSFEALLELADLLGQVKPPTVSKDDIEKSGLELIKPAQIQAYETAGKIASNCVDRCLICLDDYEAEQELRVMTCRHAFHRVCVDEWLQKGRNNCPACRSTGVTVDPLMTNATAPTTAP